MGYYTVHNLTVRNVTNQEIFDKLVDALENAGIMNYAFDSAFYGTKCNWVKQNEAQFVGGEVKWYDSNDDMKQISQQFPDLVFLLHGEGEESGDLWDAYYQNGDCEHCVAEIVYPKPERIKWE